KVVPYTSLMVAGDSELMSIPGSRICISEVHYHEDYDACTSEDDIAVLELAKNVPRHWATPICLPDREETISDDLKAAGSGWRVCQITSLFHFDTEANVQKKGSKCTI
ncbi:hypothetical protein COOONC_12347, partial [Cooperia oncophora]